MRLLDAPEKREFQSTLSMRRATDISYVFRGNKTISIHALHEESDMPYEAHTIYNLSISIHALHEESDNSWRNLLIPSRVFQSTLSMRRATATYTATRCTKLFQSTLSMRRATYR